jgi:hypothetical protein
MSLALITNHPAVDSAVRVVLSLRVALATMEVVA